MKTLRERHLAVLRQRTLRQRQRLEGDVRRLGAQLQALREELRETQLEAKGPNLVARPASAAAITNGYRYQAAMQAKQARLVEDVGQAERRLEERRAALQQAVQQTQIWEKLAARLDQKRAEREQRSAQDLLDQHSQARRSDHLR